jgi:hypothetical protein
LIPIDESGRVRSQIDVGHQLWSVSVSKTDVWALDNSGSGALAFIDPKAPTSPTSIFLADKPSCLKPTTQMSCAEIAAGDSGAWVTDPARGQLERISAAVTEERPPFGPFRWGVAGPVAFGAGKIWLLASRHDHAGHSVLYEIDPAGTPGSSKTLAAIDLGAAGAASVAYGQNAVWVGDSLTNELLRVDPGTRRVEPIAISTHVSDQPGTVAVGGGSAWVLGPEGADGSAAVARVNPQTNQTTVVASHVQIDSTSRLAVSGHAAWVTGSDALTRVAFR